MGNNKWHEIWERRNEDRKVLDSGDFKQIFLELKRISGWDSTGSMLEFEQFNNQYIQIKNELEFCPQLRLKKDKSIFEVGCGCGANLYLFQNDGYQVGGIDYSSKMIEIAHTVLNTPEELICDEAINTSCDVKYDIVLSNSVFSYFESYEYANAVLEAMYAKANYSIGIIDIHDIAKKDAFIEFRKSVIEDYEERYKDLPKFFYNRKFFTDFAQRHGMNIKFLQSNMKEYWNNDFVFNCFMTKN